MKYFYEVFLIITYQITLKECTIDINLPEFVYLSDHLTADECHRLFASLHFITYDLPGAISNAQENVPKDIPCIKLLLKWNSGQEKWEGKGKSHLEVEHRLRQIGREDLADGLGKAVYHNLAKDMNDTLVNTTCLENTKEAIVHYDLVTDKEFKNESDEWTAIDSVLWVVLVGILGTLLVGFCRIIVTTFKKSESPCKHGDELIDLLTVDSDLEATVYEFRHENKVDRKINAPDVTNKYVKS